MASSKLMLSAYNSKNVIRMLEIDCSKKLIKSKVYRAAKVWKKGSTLCK